MVSLEVFIDIILLPLYTSGVDSASNGNECQVYSLGVWEWGGVKAAGAYGWPYHLRVQTVFKYGRLNLLEPSGPVQAWIALPLKKKWYTIQTMYLHFFNVNVIVLNIFQYG